MERIDQFLLFILYYQMIVSSFLIMAGKLCPKDQSLVLLQFKQGINIDATASSQCDDSGLLSYPKMMYWNRSRDCCSWDGVTCDKFSRQVIGLDLSCSQIQGEVKSNSTLFQLSHLQSLNLAYNDFSPSGISSNFARLQGLRHLNLSNSGFSGSLPSEFLRLSNLISLDLSCFGEIIIHPRVFELLLQNLTQLREVSLESANITSVLPHNLSGTLTVLNLASTFLYGETPVELFQLPNIQSLRLDNNLHLTGDLSKVKWNTCSALGYLDISVTAFSGVVPESIGNLKSLYYLDLSFCKFSGSIPESLGNLPQITSLTLSYNNFSRQLPSSLANLQQLINLDLSSNSLEGQLPNFFFNFRKLTELSLSNNLFNGYFPSSLFNLTKLEGLDLSNNSLTGPLPLNIGGFQNLVLLFLGENSFNGTIPSWVFSLPSLLFLGMNSNQLTGQVYEFQYSLQRIYLSGNKLQGPIPRSISKLVNVTVLDLSFNNFSGDVDVSWFSNLSQLGYLDLSFNNLSLTNPVNSTLPPSIGSLFLSSCGVKDLDFLIGMNNLLKLDLSDNMLHGRIFADQNSSTWAQNLFYLNLSRNFLTGVHQQSFKYLVYFDLRSNLLSGPLFIVPSFSMQYFLASDNNFTGEIPSSICNLTSLVLLDLSNNNLSGEIPQCLGNISLWLMVLDLHTNNFHGIIPSNFSVGSKLRSLNLRDNWLEGTIPGSLSNCQELQVVDIGSNNLNGMFPRWLETLPKLQVLSLRANNFYGPLSVSSRKLSFPTLRILDLSRNEFTGILPSSFFTKLGGMKILTGDVGQPMFTGELLYYQNSLVITTKGMDLDIKSILSIFTTIDLSSNKFQGIIPDVIGNLISLQGLNLSHNSLGGHIPTTLGNLISLESLDLSTNQLKGEIPQQLTALTYLSALNLSKNHLVGRIPQGQQFDTFENASYLGNDGLCGFPLSKTCGANDQSLPPRSRNPAWDDHQDSEAFMDGFTWKDLLIGYGCGMVVGVIMGCLSFITAKPTWFNKIVEQQSSKLVKKKWPKDVKWLSIVM